VGSAVGEGGWRGAGADGGQRARHGALPRTVAGAAAHFAADGIPAVGHTVVFEGREAAETVSNEGTGSWLL
jgi:hypothetical protein